MLRSVLHTFLLPLVLFACALQATAQNHIKWAFTTKEAGKGQYDLIITGTLDENHYTYSQIQESDDGPNPTEVAFEEGPHFKLIGKTTETGNTKAFDSAFRMTVNKFKHKAIFTQRVQVLDATKPITGYIAAQVCDDRQCYPPTPYDFKFQITPSKSTAEVAPATVKEPGNNIAIAPVVEVPAPPTIDTTSKAASTNPTPPSDPNFKGFFDAKRLSINGAQFVNNCGDDASSTLAMSGFGIFIGGFLGGLLALLTPCVFPMIPMTVSFFVKRSKNRKTGLRNAFLYAGSIVLIYMALGVAVTAAFGPTFLNEMSTNMYFNLFFFVIFVVFALSFFGLFEITLPSSWVNKSDQMADKGGLIGIFFMAFTLALVSFSCTGPIVGTLLVEASRANSGASLFGVLPLLPLVGMFGFGLALALPFGLFAMFPGWLNSLPKSGGWMDNVKLTLGIVELALALKFLSTADMVEHWGLLKFETFLILWLVLSVLLAAYQFGLMGWKGAKGTPGITRSIVGVIALAFAGYLGWGLVSYKSLSLLSGLAPPVYYSYKYDGMKKAGNTHETGCPLDLPCYHDFDEGMAIAKLENKPVFIDFTGYGCVNCRKMEENVWDKPGIIEHLRNNYVVISLYVDDKERLFPDSRFSYLQDPNTQAKFRTVGDKWAQFEVTNFGQASQPWYVLMHHDGKTVLNKPRGYTPEVEQYKAFLDCGFEAFKQVKNGDGQPLMGVQ